MLSNVIFSIVRVAFFTLVLLPLCYCGLHYVDCVEDFHRTPASWRAHIENHHLKGLF